MSWCYFFNGAFIALNLRLSLNSKKVSIPGNYIMEINIKSLVIKDISFYYIKMVGIEFRLRILHLKKFSEIHV